MFSGENSEAMEFGADQAIIVRDEGESRFFLETDPEADYLLFGFLDVAAKMEFQQLVKNKNVGIVLTILQAKGRSFSIRSRFVRELETDAHRFFYRIGVYGCVASEPLRQFDFLRISVETSSVRNPRRTFAGVRRDEAW